MGASRRNSAAAGALLAAALLISGKSGAAGGWSAPVAPAPAAFPFHRWAGHAIDRDRGHEWGGRRNRLGPVAGVGVAVPEPEGADVHPPYDFYPPYESPAFAPAPSTGPRIIEIAAGRAPRRGHLPVIVYGDPLR
jgi:hypothetical protein